MACGISDPRQRLVFARPVNPAFAVIEVIWILAGANDLQFLRFWNPRMERFSDDGASLAGAYGHRLGSRPDLPSETADQLRRRVSTAQMELDQLRAALHAFIHNADTRQVVLQYWDARRDFPLPAERSKDVPCNIMSHLLVRDGRLEWLQVIRSNDPIWGMPYNLFQFSAVQEVLAGWLGIELGSYQQVSNSLHVYERFWQDLDDLDLSGKAVPINTADLRLGPYDVWEKHFSRLVELTMGLAASATAGELVRLAEDSSEMPPAYQEWVWLLTAEALRRRGHTLGFDVIHRAGPYWAESWLQWVDSRGDVHNWAPES